MTPPARHPFSQMNFALEWKRYGEVFTDIGVGEEMRHPESHPDDIRTFLLGLLVAAFTFHGGNLRLRDTRQQLERCLPHPAASVLLDSCFVSGSYPSPRKALRL